MAPKKTPLKGLVICVCGEFGKGRTRSQMKTWIEINGAEYVTELDPNVTHLICSEQEFKPDNELIKEAYVRPKARIVTYDWLEDSIIQRRNLGTKEYEWVRQLKDKKKQKRVQKKSEAKKLKKDAEAFQDGVEAARSDINSGESDSEVDATQSMNKLVFNGFMETRDKKQAAKKQAKAEDRAAKAKKRKAKANPEEVVSSGNVSSTTSSSSKRAKVSKDDHASASASNAESSKKGKMKAVSQGEQQTSTNQSSGTKKRDKSPVKKESMLEKYGVKRQKRSREKPTMFENGIAVKALKMPTVDPSKIRPAPTREQVQARELEKANEQWSFPENYHVYRDPGTGLDYAIVLVRVLNIMSNDPPERILLRMFESNTEPTKYATYYKRILSSLNFEEGIVVPLGSNFELAFRKFRELFKDFTHVDWASREQARARAGVMPVPQKFTKADGSEVTETPFLYLWKQPVV